MATELAAFIKAGLALDPDERAVAANRLMASLHESDADQGDVDTAWSKEINNRVDDILERNVELVDADTHFARLRAELSARRA